MHSWKHNTSILVRLDDFGRCSRAHGVVVSHPLRMRRAGFNSQCVHFATQKESWNVVRTWSPGQNEPKQLKMQCH